MRRGRIGKRSSRRMFTRNAGAQRKNFSAPVMRGGIRL